MKLKNLTKSDPFNNGITSTSLEIRNLESIIEGVWEGEKSTALLHLYLLDL
jgi:hypothetical protein